MAICYECGEEIEFRVINGRPIPIHLSGRWCQGRNRSNASASVRATSNDTGYHPRTARSEESCCWMTKCPECTNPVYFIRHNGGSVWIDPPLGWPWYKHSCMHPESPKATRKTLGDPGLGLAHYSQNCLIGVVKEAESSASGNSSIVKVETDNKKSCVLLLKRDAVFLVGQLILYRKEEKTVKFFEDEAYCAYSVLAEMVAEDQSTELFKCPECNLEVQRKLFEQHLHEHFASETVWNDGN